MVASGESLIARWQRLRREVEAHGARLVAVSKYAPDAAVAALVDAGCRAFAESRPQALRDRARKWPDCQWHMIGPLQRNKAKYIGRYAACWHSLCDAETAQAVARHVQGRRLPVLIQVNLSGDSQRHGVLPEALPMLLQALADMPSLQPIGLMTMPPRGADARTIFARLRNLRDALDQPALIELSMGMSHDYQQALAEGASIVRIGSMLFGAWDIRHTREHVDAT